MAAIKQAGGVARATRTKARMAKKKVEEARILTENKKAEVSTLEIKLKRIE